MAQRWSAEQITVLIDAYKEEPCLYATNTPNYHNKNLRTMALNRVNNAVLRLRPASTTKECSNKFHNLRNQFNIEHSKVKSSLKSGTGTDDIYKPSLWYYEKLLFLDSYVIPRRNRTSLDSQVSLSDMPLSQGTATHMMEENSEDGACYENVEYVEDVFITELDGMIRAQENLCGSSSTIQVSDTNSTLLQIHKHSSPSPHRSRSSSLSSVTANNLQENTFPRPHSSSQSSSSTSGVGSSAKRKRKNPRLDDSDEFSTVIKNLTDSINAPITINTPPTNSTPDCVDGFLTFMGSLLRQFRDEQLKLEVMNEVTQLIINAKTTDYQRSKN
ncbi:uncharacterized protein [Neodiprion pinetum]|uniref:uncharacterized protein n=1 Tax=Neodiprion pinetum TaxID=441929 RepID=UPI0037187CA0